MYNKYDDYLLYCLRSECENCKTANVSGADDDGEAMNETMSLQRRPLSESGYELSYRTSLTLPTHSRKQRFVPFNLLFVSSTCN